jgi:hypothetical protein
MVVSVSNVRRGRVQVLFGHQKQRKERIHKVILSFTPYSLFAWYRQSKETLLNLNMKCWNSAFNAQGSRVIIVVVQVRTVKIYVAAVEALKKKERQDEAKLPKLVEKLVWDPVILFCKISFSVTHLMPCYAETGRSRPPNRLTDNFTGPLFLAVHLTLKTNCTKKNKWPGKYCDLA